MHRIALASCLVAAISGCAVEGADEPTSDTWQPIASLTTDNGLTVEFYEPEPGALMIMQDAAVGVPPVTGHPRPVDLYRALAPDQPVPAALIAAQQRADDVNGDPSEADPAADKRAIDAIGTDYAIKSVEVNPAYIDNQSCDDQWFEDTFCNFSSTLDWTMCLLNHWDGAYAKSGSGGVDVANFSTCADIGNVTLKVTMGDGDGGLWDVLEGHYRNYWWFSNIWGTNETARGDIVNASGNRFHMGAAFEF
jgi:hypothetical protein